jgi:hypothetical protein
MFGRSHPFNYNNKNKRRPPLAAFDHNRIRGIPEASMRPAVTAFSHHLAPRSGRADREKHSGPTCGTMTGREPRCAGKCIPINLFNKPVEEEAS